MCISVHPVLWREGHFVQVAAVAAALTRLDEHDRPLETFGVWANEAHGHRARAPRRAAPFIRAGATMVGPVQADAPAFAVGQVYRFWGTMDLGTLLPSL